MKKVYLLPNIVTAFGLACGLFVIFKINLKEAGVDSYHLLFVSILLLLAAALADVLDGALARAMKVESDFGAIFDSLADAISFGLAPSVLFLKSISLDQGSTLSFFAIAGAMIFSICGVLRLVRFSVSAQKAKESPDPEVVMAHKKHFTGLPIPAGAMGVVSINLLLYSPYLDSYFFSRGAFRDIILISVMVVLGYFMISRWKFPSIKALHFRVPSIRLVLITVLVAISLLYGILYLFPITFAAIVWSYIILGWILSIIRLIAGKKSKTLEDFEPEEEDEN